MRDVRKTPIALTVVSVVFLLGGIGTLIQILMAFRHGQFSIDTGILGIPIFFGLRSYSALWRTIALCLLWLGLILSPVIAALALFNKMPVDFNLFGQHVAAIPSFWLPIATIPFFVLLLWEYRVLTRPDIRVLFLPISRPPDASPNVDANASNVGG
ncbi:MAG TPA: hypothetical protein VN380_11960 [Thermoanaerobaculia bacterium]|nr:hypothetical protein [Thermoanaerobaculia bacterium]